MKVKLLLIFPMSENVTEMDRDVYLVFCVISVVISFFPLYSGFMNSRHRTFYAGKIIVFLSIFDIFAWIPGIITSAMVIDDPNLNNLEESSCCVALGFIRALSNMFTAFLILIMGIFLSYNIVYESSPVFLEKYLYGLFFILAVLFTSSPFMFLDEGYGNLDGFTCSVKNEGFKIYSFYYPCLCIMIIDLIILSIAVKKIWTYDLEMKAKFRISLKIMMFLIILIVCWLPWTLIRIINQDKTIALDDKIKTIAYTLMPVQGILNPIAYYYLNHYTQQITPGKESIPKTTGGIAESLLSSEGSQT